MTARQTKQDDTTPPSAKLDSQWYQKSKLALGGVAQRGMIRHLPSNFKVKHEFFLREIVLAESRYSAPLPGGVPVRAQTAERATLTYRRSHTQRV